MSNMAEYNFIKCTCCFNGKTQADSPRKSTLTNSQWYSNFFSWIYKENIKITSVA